MSQVSFCWCHHFNTDRQKGRDSGVCSSVRSLNGEILTRDIQSPMLQLLRCQSTAEKTTSSHSLELWFIEEFIQNTQVQRHWLLNDFFLNITNMVNIKIKWIFVCTYLSVLKRNKYLYRCVIWSLQTGLGKYWDRAEAGPFLRCQHGGLWGVQTHKKNEIFTV